MSQALANAFEKMKARFKPGTMDGTMSFYFSLGDDEGQKWTMTLTAETIEVKPGKHDADVVLKTSEERFLKLLRGEWTPGPMDFMRGKIKSNDPTKLMVLKECFTSA